MGMNSKNTLSKQKLYKTAFSTEFNVYVSLRDAQENDDGSWTYWGSSFYKEGVTLQNHKFHESELEMFCL
jgi:hypothetical protein